MNFEPHGIELTSLPQDKEFLLYLSFHAVYEFAIGDRRYAEIGTVYCLQRLGAPGLPSVRRRSAISTQLFWLNSPAFDALPKTEP